MILGINEQTWEVVKVPAHDPLLIVDGQSCAGTTWCGHQKIALSDELSGDHAHRIIAHELGHAILYATQACKPESYSEEDLCEFLGIYSRLLCMLEEDIYKELFKAEEASCKHVLS